MIMRGAYANFILSGCMELGHSTHSFKLHTDYPTRLNMLSRSFLIPRIGHLLRLPNVHWQFTAPVPRGEGRALVTLILPWM